MVNLMRASRELFSRPPDECFPSLVALHEHCLRHKERSTSLTESIADFAPVFQDGQLRLKLNGHAPFRLNDWSFTQLCYLAGAAKATVNRLLPQTAVQVCSELLAQRGDQQGDLQALVSENHVVRSVNGDRYTRLWNAELLAMLRESATGFSPPQKGFNGGTGLYAGEQDMFCFLIDPTGWVEIGQEAFAPGFFVWNSEVGRRAVGVATFWFQAVCANHIVWDAMEFKQYTRRHIGNVQDALRLIRGIIEALVARRDQRKDRFAAVIRRATTTTYGHTSEEVTELLTKAGFQALLAKRAAALAREKGRFTIWSVVDALTQLAREHRFAGSRTDADTLAAGLLELVAA